MTRETASHNKIALLATGDEITNGDIQNTNSQTIAQQLFASGMLIGMHLSVSDSITEIEDAMQFLLKTHRAIIITGGLGPTSDDLTRYALSKVINQPLIFDDNTWQNICARFIAFGYQGTPPEGNRQQALFPPGAKIIPNPNGTAAGCFVLQEKQLIFMLPGPPTECLPMVKETVIPQLIQQQFQEIVCYDRWLLFGVSEGEIAQKLDALAKPFNCTTGYRLCYPYIEFKIISHHRKDFDALVPIIQHAIQPYLFQDGKAAASALLLQKLQHTNEMLFIEDTATGGLLESSLMTPKTHAAVSFSPHSPEKFSFKITVTGLKEFWESSKTSKHTSLNIVFQKNSLEKSFQIEIPLRGERTKLYAVEYICQKVYEFLDIS